MDLDHARLPLHSDERVTFEREKVDLDHARLPLHSDERVTYSKFISMSLIAFCS